MADIENAGGLAAYLSIKPPPPPRDPNQDANQHDCYHQTSAGQGYDHAVGYQATTFSGALTTTPVYQPTLDDYVNEHSLSQMWVQTGDCEDWSSLYGGTNPCLASGGGPSADAVQSVEVGWMVGNDFAAPYPWLFAFITTNGYSADSNGLCWAHPAFASWNNLCAYAGGGWVDAPGAPYTPGVTTLGAYVQALGQAPDEMSIQIWNGHYDGYDAWYVWLDGQLLGWYASSLFHGTMQTQATYVQVGGEVFDAWENGQATSSQMGTGYIRGGPNHAFQYEFAAYHRNVSLISSADTYSDASLSYVITPSAEGDLNRPGICGYEAGDVGDILTEGTSGTSWHSYFFFGQNYLFGTP